MVLRPTLAADLPSCIAEPLPHRIRCISAVIPGEEPGTERVIGIGGIGYRPDGTVVAFAQLMPEFLQYPRAVHRAGRAGMALIRKSRVPTVIAETDPGNAAAARWLLHFGFVAREVGGHKVFVWRRSSTDVE